ncbi:probable Coatomer subunit alpha [Saccharomycodes ludwigii]|uniref:Coatomer subunit alpha n=1 Tax=Saccharomycodes ludwigii TaxID=36035 RepID=A0A376B4Y4_9ASCO|nr:hypothetical protein SCDLUD_000260 [Saccharomycodes ludwigii]KAH3902677.1 hypothetical protein SCDLUD_000260 [Saccharomycodes ludwigii]SSD59748.1 probable Coatomer subunit alpha [Saccharomycodes ludwigii]
MKMLTKFESKSTRAKGITFHASRPWALVALFSSTIQLWDYRMGTLLHRYEDHEGPVRGIDFHPTQPLFVSAGDDSTIKVWSLETHKCLFTLTGHLDYVRTVFFHHELPWIISCSDDQTIRIWNWQNRKEIACLTGHNHFVMCAQFHPTEDLVVSASLDETVRVWDISGLRKKHSAPSTISLEEQLNASQNLLDGGFGDCVVKFILEGHTRGVNWATFHPTLPLIVSGGDDRQIKLWRMSATKAWEVDTCRGHTNNVNSVIFHPYQDLIISVSEDKTIRTWDLNKRTPVKQFRRDNDRFWLIAAHPKVNLFGAAHDSGIMVFKLDRERPPFVNNQNQLIFINKEKQVQIFDYKKKITSLPLVSLKGVDNTWNAFRNICYNPSQHSILINTGENDKFALCVLPRDATGAVEPSNLIFDQGSFATFVARNRFVVYDKASQSIEIRDLNNKKTKNIKVDGVVNDIVTAQPGSVLLLKPKSVVHFDVQQGKIISEVEVNNVKYVSWSQDGQYLALLSKHTITIVDKNMQTITSMHETIRIKSASWDESHVLIYSTLNHIKYCLLNGDNGIIRTLENTLYTTRVQGKYVYALNRSGEVEILTIDPTEYRFKKALVNKNFPEVLKIIKTSNLVGENIIAYLQKAGYPEIALQFVQDPQTRFDLALEDGDLNIALEECSKLNSPDEWAVLGENALLQGNAGLSELVYQNNKEFDKLSFLYLATGDKSKLAKMESIAENRGDASSVILNTIYSNNVTKRSEVFHRFGSLPLAYAVAKSNGIDASSILEEASIDESKIVLPDGISSSKFVKSSTLSEPLTVWPLKKTDLSYFEKVVLGQIENLDLQGNEEQQQQEEESSDVTQEEPLFEDEEPLDIKDTAAGAADDAWDLGDEDLGIDDEDDFADLATNTNKIPDMDMEESETSMDELAKWVQTSKLPAVLAAAGAFDAAAQALNKQAGVYNFEPLTQRFIDVYESSKLYMTATPEELPSVTGYIRKDPENTSVILPSIPGISVINSKVSSGFKLFKANKLEEAIEKFREVIYTVCLLIVDNQEDEEKAFEALKLAREYILGLSIELKRRSLPVTDVKRNLELAAYFAKVNLLPAHRVNALQVAMTQSFKNKNFVQASYFAEEFLKIAPSGPRAEQARKVKNRADSIAHDAHEIEFDPYAKFDICAATYTPIYEGSPSVIDPLTGTKYHPSEKGKIDRISLISKIGAPASGLRIHV